MNTYQKIRNTLPDHVKLIAVSKTHSPESIMSVYSQGQNAFAENKVQELLLKKDHLPQDIEWHFIGHLQTNKVKSIAPFIHLIHSIDSMKLLKEINKEAMKNQRIIHGLIEMHIAEEKSKNGLSPDTIFPFIEEYKSSELKNVRLSGVMGMATYTEDKEKIRREFNQLHKMFDKIKGSLRDEDKQEFKEISMGMSSDYKIAIEEGSTMVRIGSAIFGER